MFDMDGRIGNWKFAKPKSTRVPMFEPITEYRYSERYVFNRPRCESRPSCHKCGKEPDVYATHGLCAKCHAEEAPKPATPAEVLNPWIPESAKRFLIDIGVMADPVLLGLCKTRYCKQEGAE